MPSRNTGKRNSTRQSNQKRPGHKKEGSKKESRVQDEGSKLEMYSNETMMRRDAAGRRGRERRRRLDVEKRIKNRKAKLGKTRRKNEKSEQ